MPILPKSFGYSLIELLVAISIIIMMTGGGIAAYRNFDQRQTLVNAGRKLEGTIRTTQKQAQSGQKPEECVDSATTLDGWQVRGQNGNLISSSAVCEGNPAAETSYQLTNGISINDFRLNFAVNTGLITGHNSVNIILSKGDRSYNIEVSAAGSVTGALE